MTGKIALIIVDVQNDFLEKGSLAVPDSNVILEPVNQLMIRIKQLGGLVIATQVKEKKLLRICINVSNRIGIQTTTSVLLQIITSQYLVHIELSMKVNGWIK